MTNNNYNDLNNEELDEDQDNERTFSSRKFFNFLPQEIFGVTSVE